MDDVAKRVSARILQAMAYDRQTFKNKAEEHIGGALLEFYKAALAKKNGQSKWVRHWTTEVRNLIDRSLFATIKHSIRGFKDRKKALYEVISYVRSIDTSYRRSAEHIVLKDFGLKSLKIFLDDSDTEAFWKLVHEAIEAGLIGLVQD